MKTTFVYSLVFVLAVSLAATGCRHKPVNVTPMKAAPTPTLPPEPGPTTINPGPTIIPNLSGSNPEPDTGGRLSLRHGSRPPGAGGLYNSFRLR